MPVNARAVQGERAAQRLQQGFFETLAGFGRVQNRFVQQCMPIADLDVGKRQQKVQLRDRLRIGQAGGLIGGRITRRHVVGRLIPVMPVWIGGGIAFRCGGVLHLRGGTCGRVFRCVGSRFGQLKGGGLGRCG